MPPRPGGVATATMVSVTAKATGTVQTVLGQTFREITTLLRNASPMLSDVSVGVFGHRQVDDAPGVGIERADFLRHARRPRLVHEEERHLAQLGVLVLAEAERVDDVVPIAARVAAKRGVDDDLQRVERLALAAEQDVGALAREIEADVVRQSPRSSPRGRGPWPT